MFKSLGWKAFLEIVLLFFKEIGKMKKVGRNEVCHCGSGKKYKNCHQGLDTPVATQNKRLYIGGAIAILLIIISISLYFSQQPSVNNAPPGKVWSEEHGHWHDE